MTLFRFDNNRSHQNLIDTLNHQLSGRSAYSKRWMTVLTVGAAAICGGILLNLWFAAGVVWFSVVFAYIYFHLWIGRNSIW